MTSQNYAANLRNSVNLKGPKPENIILQRNLTFKSLVRETKETPFSGSLTVGSKTKTSVNLKDPKPENVILEKNLSLTSFKSLIQDNPSPKILKKGKNGATESLSVLSFPEPVVFPSPRPVTELDAAAVTLQKVYKSYRTRRNLADCAVVVEELWWQALDFAALKQSSVSFFNDEKPETAVSRWARAGTRAAKVGKGLSKDDKAQKLALQHWLEAIDPRHRYGHNLHLYYDIWFESESTQPFFFWLDVGDGKEVNLDKCPRTLLQQQSITYLGPKREAYEVVVRNGKLVYRQSEVFVETPEGSKWIFVLSTTRTLYVGQKTKGLFHHSSFLAGAAIIAAGGLVAHGGIIEAIWPYSGHYRPPEENFREFISFLEENHVDLTNVKMFAADDDTPPKKSVEADPASESKVAPREPPKSDGPDEPTNTIDPPLGFDLSKRLLCSWTTGAGPRIGCVRDYPTDLQTRALEQVNLSPRVVTGPVVSYGPIPSPRPSPKVRLSPRLAYMGLLSPRS